MSSVFGQVAAPVQPNTLVDGRDAQVIACERTTPQRCIGVRWASAPAYGFPRDGYAVWRVEIDANGKLGQPVLLGDFTLPVTTDWNAFAADVTARAPAAGPWFPSINQSELAFLLPVIRFADLRTPDAERSALCTQLASWLGNPHENDAELAWRFWGQALPPSLQSLLANQATAQAIFEYYWRYAVAFLHLLAQRFEYAVLLGLGTDDAGAPAGATVRYYLQIKLGLGTDDAGTPAGATVRYYLQINPERSGAVHSQDVPPGRHCRPTAPAWCRAVRVPGTIPHPAFATWPTWTPPAGFAPVDPDGQPLPARALVPRSPAAFTALTWAGPPERRTLLSHDPVLYRIRRFSHGAASASLGTAPVLPAVAAFQEIVPGELVRRGDSEPHFTDLPGMPWPALEGWYEYEVVGVDLLGVLSDPAPRTTLRHFDDFAPPAPRVRVTTGHTATIAQNATSASVDLAIDWSSGEDFNGPDAREFRVAVQWVPLELTAARIDAVTDAGLFNLELTLSGWTQALGTWDGAIISVPGTDYPVVSAALTGGVLRVVVRRVANRVPAAGTDALVRRAGSPGPMTRAARLARSPLSTCTVAAAGFGVVNGVQMLTVDIAAAGASALPADAEGSLYVHVMRATFDAIWIAAAQWRIAAPPVESPARAVWDQCVAAPNSLVGSPLIFFPRHSLTVTLTPPNGFTSGMAVLALTAADGAQYRASASLPVADPALANVTGNESAATETIVSVRSLQQPQTASVPPYDPSRRQWATSAAQYAENAQYDVTWSAAGGAARYEVWRALDAALGAAAFDDLALRAGAAAAPTSTFELRTDQAFGTHFLDSLPGRAPTRAVYRIRAISAAEERGAFSDVIGPVYVPDVRPPSQPNLLRVVAIDPVEQDSAIAIEWTQPGDQTDVRYEIEWREEQAATFQSAGTVARGAAVPAADGRFRFVHGARVPGRRYAYRVRSVREALDPIDPAAVARRDIESPPSVVRIGSAITALPLAAPDTLVFAVDAAAQSVSVTWVNQDVYDEIELWRRPVDRNIFLRVGQPLNGQQQQASDLAVPAGSYVYQVRARLGRRSARTPESNEVIVP
ncbi:hypothetical protein [Methylibium petroleiphilum]|uniref:hypothetical protein n=1 Tax=Methylibium petroleiphilum TaxID=105560 RepID=UPI003D283744